GLTDQQVDVVNKTITPGWKYQFSETWSVLMELSYSDIMYDQPLLDGYNNAEVVKFTDRTNKSASATLEYSFTEKDSLSLLASAANNNQVVSENKFLERGELCDNFSDCYGTYGFFTNSVSVASDIDVEIKSKTWQLGYEHQFSEISSIGINAGKYKSDEITNERRHFFDTALGNELAVDTWNTTPREQVATVYNLMYQYTGYTSQVSFNMSRDRIASSTGGTDDVESAKIIFRGEVTERYTWSIDVNAERRLPDKIAVAVRSVEDSTRINAVPTLHYKLDEDWSMSLGYRYSKLDTKNIEQPGEANAVFFTMSWREPKLLSTN
ncbi:MAG: hypothetical protein HYZ31_01820, partial [Gammaproteobacteria bacterium]|nr:hypothetical protein [Gammaproteobacteria bacterium]